MSVYGEESFLITSGLDLLVSCYAAECLSLPCHTHMSDDDVQAVIKALNSFKG